MSLKVGDCVVYDYREESLVPERVTWPNLVGEVASGGINNGNGMPINYRSINGFGWNVRTEKLVHIAAKDYARLLLLYHAGVLDLSDIEEVLLAAKKKWPPNVYRHPNGQDRIRIVVAGKPKDIWLGKTGSPEARQEYLRVLAHLEAHGGIPGSRGTEQFEIESKTY